MATIVFTMKWGSGHLNPTFALARALADRGHRIVYAGIDEFEETVVARGFEYVRVLESLGPRWLTALGERAKNASRLEMLRLLWSVRALRKKMNAALDADLARVVSEIRPTLMLVDTVMPE